MLNKTWGERKQKNLLMLSRVRLAITHMASIDKQAPSAPTVGSCCNCMQWNLQERNMGLYSCLLWVTVFTLHYYYDRYPVPAAP